MGNKMEGVMSKRMFLSLEMVQWFNPPPSRNPHESALAEARIPPEPSNLCPLAVSLSAFFFFSYRPQNQNRHNTVRHGPLSPSKQVFTAF